MTISATTSTVTYNGNGSTTAFPFSFPIPESSHLEVVLTDADEVSTLLVAGTDYTATGFGTDNGGTVTTTTAPATGERITLRRVLPIKQETDLVTGAALYAEVLEDQFDRVVMICQQLEEKIERSVKVPIGSTTLPEDYLSTVGGYRDDAAASAAAADASATSAASSATAADASADAAAASATAAAASETAAANSATDAAASAAAAEVAKIEWQGEWAPGTYQQHDAVGHMGSSWVANKTTSNEPPTTPAGTDPDWDLQAAKGADGVGSIEAISAGTGLTGGGSSGTVSLAVDFATKAQAEGGTDTTHPMNALGVAQAIAALTGIYAVTAGESITDRDLIYQDMHNERGGGADRWYKVDTDSANAYFSKRIGIALTGIASGSTGPAQVLHGKVSGFTGLTAGAPIYASTTAGGITQTPPPIPTSGTQAATIVVGYAASATEVDFVPPASIVVLARNSALASGSSITVRHPTDAGARERQVFAYIVAAASGFSYANPGGSGNRTASIGVSSVGLASTATTACVDGSTGGTYFNIGGGGASVVGKSITFDFGSPVAFDAFRAYTDNTITNGTWKWQGSSDGTSYADVPGTTSFPWNTTASAWNENAVFGSPTATYRYWRMAGVSGTGASTFVYEMEFRITVSLGGYEDPIIVSSEGVSSGATDRVTCHFADASGLNGSTYTTFYNRTGATRDMVVEVVL